MCTMDYPKFIVSKQKEELISIQRITFRLVPFQVLNVHDDQRLCRSRGGLSKMVFNAFYEHDYHAGLVNFNNPHLTYN